MKRPTITDIAKACGVTDGTVSRALSGDSRVKPETRARIQASARALGYVANQSARLFKTGKTKNIGIFCDSGSWMLYNYYFGPLIAGLIEAAQEGGYRSVLYLPEIGRLPKSGNPDHQPVRLKGAEEFQDGRVDAAVVVGGRTSVQSDIETLKSLKLPVVLLSNNTPIQGLSQLNSGARDRVRQIAAFLIARQKAVPALLGLYEGSSYNLESEAGWREAIKSAGLSEPPDFVVGISRANLADGAEIAAKVSQAIATGARSVICGDIAQALRIFDLQREGRISLPKDFLVGSFGPLPYVITERPKNLILLECDLLAEGKRAFSLVKKALEREAPKTEIMHWKI